VPQRPSTRPSFMATEDKASSAGLLFAFSS
jgi:hypothetical protein